MFARKAADRIQHVRNLKTFPLGSARRGIGRSALIGGLAALVLASFSVFGLYLYVYGAAPNPSEQLEIAMRLMRKGDSESPYRIAKSISPKLLKKRADLSKREFLIGASERRAAEGIIQRRIANEKNEQAVKHLEKSRELTFPDGYEGQGNYYLGMALFDLFRWDEAESPLEVAADRWPPGRADSIERLIDIDLSFENQDPESALSRITHWRSLPRSSANELDRTYIKEMQSRFQAGDYANAASLLEYIPADSIYKPNADLVHGRCMQRLANSESESGRKEKLQIALSDFQRIMASPKSSVVCRRQGALELARVMRDLGQKTQAVSAFGALRLSSPFEPESLVSGLDEIDGLIDIGRIADAANTMEHITNNFGEMRWYANDWIPFSKMQSQIVASGERMIASQDFVAAARFANNLPPFCDDLDRMRMKSKLYEQWANSLANQPDNGLCKAYHLQAAEAYESLSMKQMRTPQFEELLWRAIENYRLSGAFKKSNFLLENYYLRFEPRENLPKGLLALARNYNALNEPDLAMNSLNRILDSNTSTSLVHDARLEAARLSTAKEKYQEAEELVIQNLYYSDLAPSSPVWRESLFLLSDVLFRRGLSLFNQAQEAMIRDSSKSYENLAIIEKSYEELLRSIRRTKEGLARFEKDPRRLQTLYTMAKAYKMASMWPEMLLREERNANDDSITKWKALRKELLNESKNAYAKIVEEITISGNEIAKDTNSENLLRSSYFGVADLLFESGAYEESIAAYQEVAAHFIGEPESLEAMVQISNAQKKLGKNPEGLRTLEMAKDVLSRIPPEKNNRFTLVTSHDRIGWQQYIDWLIKEMRAR